MISPSKLIEKEISASIINPDTGRTSRTFRYFGKLDLMIDGWLYDWKIVADPIGYLNEKSIGYQLDLYADALQREGVQIVGKRFRLIRRPTIKLKKNQTPGDYEEECVAWLSNPEKNALVELDIPVTDARIDAGRRWLWSVSQRILASRRSGQWLCNEHACKSFNRVCDFMPLCYAEANGLDVSYKIQTEYEEKEKQHEELEEITIDLDTLTYSSASTFASCEKKYYWKYEARIRKAIEEEPDALRIGKWTHEALAVLSSDGADAASSRLIDLARSTDAIGDDMRKVEEQASKCAAIVKVAAMRWPELVGIKS